MEGIISDGISDNDSGYGTPIVKEADHLTRINEEFETNEHLRRENKALVLENKELKKQKENVEEKLKNAIIVWEEYVNYEKERVTPVLETISDENEIVLYDVKGQKPTTSRGCNNVQDNKFRTKYTYRYLIHVGGGLPRVARHFLQSPPFSTTTPDREGRHRYLVNLARCAIVDVDLQRAKKPSTVRRSCRTNDSWNSTP